jgi:eukaryotic-like serine/threonine-protein kinase
MGVVYEAFDRERGARVALKTLHTLSAEGLARFKNEFRALQDLHHPNLVRLDELLEDHGRWFFTMELVDGVNFFEWVRPHDPGLPGVLDEVDSVASAETAAGPFAPAADEGAPVRARLGRLDEGRLRDGLRQLVLGLSALHDARKVHRDIKPGNVLVTPAGRVVVLDFGLITDAYRDREGRPVGTGVFMAPEQGAGEAVGPAADWYSVGVTLYLALTGRAPFLGTFDQVVELKRHVDPEPPVRYAPEAPFELNVLCMELLRRDPRERPEAHDILAHLGAAARTPRGRATFVGREHEQAALDAALAAAPGAVLVHGASGVGKSALVLRWLRRVSRARQALVLAGRCYERESVPYKALDQVVDALARALCRLDDAQVATLLPRDGLLLAKVFPVLAQVPVIGAALDAQQGRSRDGDPVAKRGLLFAALRELLARLGQRGPVVLAIDDLQWSDADSLALLAELLAPPDPPRLLLCATVRADAEGLPLATLQARLGAALLAVEPLPAAQARELAESLLGHGEAAGEVVAEAGGHPLFIDALARHRLAHPGASGALRLDDVLVARSAELGAAARALLQLICVAGTPVQQEACAHAAGLGFGELVEQVSALRAAQLVKTHGVHRGDTVEPYHDRVREALVARLDGPTRRGLHERLARALEASGTADPETLAVHFRGAGDAHTAARHAARAADQASRALAFDRAARLYREALELDPQGGDALRLRLAEALASAGRGRESALEYLALAPHQGMDTIELRRRAAEQFLRGGFLDEGLAALDQVLQTIGAHLPRGRGERLRSFLWQRLRLRLRGYGYTLRARDDVPPETLRRLQILRSMHSLGMSNIVASQDFLTRHLRESLDLGLAAPIVEALVPETIYVAAPGLRARGRAERLVHEARTLAESLGDPLLLGLVEAASGIADYLIGRWRPALAQLDAAEKTLSGRARGSVWETDTVQLFGVRTLAFLGELGELRRRLAALQKSARDRGDLYMRTNLAIGFPFAYVCAAQDQPELAAHAASAMMKEWCHAGPLVEEFHDFQGQATCELYAGEAGAAQRRVDATWPRLRRALFLRIQVGRAISLHLRGRIALACGRAPDALADARRLEREDAEWVEPLAALLRAGAAKLRGDEDGALDGLVRGERGAEEAGMRLFAAAARRQRGLLLGGDEGRRLREEADVELRGEGVVRVERMAEVMVPGFGR